MKRLQGATSNIFRLTAIFSCLSVMLFAQALPVAADLSTDDVDAIYNSWPGWVAGDDLICGEQAGANSQPGQPVQMIKTDTSNFHPDPQATSYFNKISLPMIKKYLSVYVTSAQLEGVTQNWEILPALHGPELGFKIFFEANYLGPKGPSGPYQETASELVKYLDDPTYGPTLKTLIEPDGTAKKIPEINSAQFTVLSRLVFARWIKEALGSGYNNLTKGPIPFNPTVDSNNTLWKIIHRWNATMEESEGFNGYDVNNHPYRTSPSVWPGMATTYYLLKQWEDGGGMATVAAASVSCTPGAAVSADCNAPAGTGRILCAARRYTGIYYHFGGGHDVGVAQFRKQCPDPTKVRSTAADPGPCRLDCSGLASMAINDAFGQSFMRVVSGFTNDSKNFKQISINEVQPGDLATRTTEHIEIVVSYNPSSKKLVTFGTRETGTPASQVNRSASDYDRFWRYVGPGAQ